MQDGNPATRAALHNFYESYFPLPSSFELPAGRRNAHQYIDDLRRADAAQWRAVAAALALVAALGAALAAVRPSENAWFPPLPFSPKSRE